MPSSPTSTSTSSNVRVPREGAREEWAKFQFPEGWGEGRNVLAECDELAKTMTPEKDHQLVETIIIKTQGFVSGNFSENDEAPIQKFRDFLDLYKGIDKAQLRANMKYFLEAIMPTCEEYGMNMCVHPDDPPIEILGLPRIVRTEEDIQWFLDVSSLLAPTSCICAPATSSPMATSRRPPTSAVVLTSSSSAASSRRRILSCRCVSITA